MMWDLHNGSVVDSLVLNTYKQIQMKLREKWRRSYLI